MNTIRFVGGPLDGVEREVAFALPYRIMAPVCQDLRVYAEYQLCKSEDGKWYRWEAPR